jgi:hypothetical protein
VQALASLLYAILLRRATTNISQGAIWHNKIMEGYLLLILALLILWWDRKRFNKEQKQKGKKTKIIY